MEAAEKQSIDEILESFDPIGISAPPREKCEPVTLWIPTEYKAKYDLIQDRSRRRFGKILKEVLKMSIDKAIKTY